MNVMFWMRGESDRAWTIDRLEAQAVHLSATGRGALSTTHKLDLPSPVDCATIPAITRTGRLHELKLTRADAAAQSTSVTRARPDLEVHLPLTARELTEAKPSSYACATCGERLVDARGVGKYGALPSEHWAELLEAWMCHEDTDEGGSAMLNKARQLKPRDEGEALVGSTYLVFREAVVSKWRKQQGATVSVATLSVGLSKKGQLACGCRKATGLALDARQENRVARCKLLFIKRELARYRGPKAINASCRTTWRLEPHVSQATGAGTLYLRSGISADWSFAPRPLATMRTTCSSRSSATAVARWSGTSSRLHAQETRRPLARLCVCGSPSTPSNPKARSRASTPRRISSRPSCSSAARRMRATASSSTTPSVAT